MPDNLDYPTMGVLLRLLYQLYSLEIKGALRDAGFEDINPAASNVFTFVTSQGATVSELANLSPFASRRWLRPSSSSNCLATSSAARIHWTADLSWSFTPRGKQIPPVTHKAAANIERRWARLLGTGEFETLRVSLLELLTGLTAE